MVKEVYDTTNILFRSAADYKAILGIAGGRKPECEYLNCSSNMRDCTASISGDSTWAQSDSKMLGIPRHSARKQCGGLGEQISNKPRTGSRWHFQHRLE